MTVPKPRLSAGFERNQKAINTLDRLFTRPASGTAETERISLVLFEKILATLRHIHEQGVVYCCLAAYNTLVDEDLNLKLVDFELARKITEDESELWPPGTMAGEPLYMAPEQALGEPLTRAADFYALGVLICQILLYSKTPFQESTVGALIQRKLCTDLREEDLIQIGVSKEVAPLLAGLLRRKADKRLVVHDSVLRQLRLLLPSSASRNSVISSEGVSATLKELVEPPQVCPKSAQNLKHASTPDTALMSALVTWRENYISLSERKLSFLTHCRDSRFKRRSITPGLRS